MASSQIVRFPAAGCVVEFMQGGRAVQAWVLGEQSGQLRLYTINKRETKLQAARLLPWSGPMYGASASRAEMDERLEAHRAKREDLAQEINLEEVWELAQGEVSQADITWFAELLWPEPEVDQVAALGQAMLARKSHFKFSPPYFEIYTEEQVRERAERQAREDRAHELATVGGEFFRKLVEAARNRTPLEEKDFPSDELATELRELLMSRIADPDAHDAEGLWKTLTKNLSAKNVADDPHLPMRLAVTWGIVPEHYNFLLDRAGYEPGDDWAQDGVLGELAADVCKEASALPEAEATCQLVSIDPASTQDFDDAFFVQEAEGGYELTLAIASPALGWPFGSAFDKQILRRSSSLYLPECNHFMLPRGLCLGSYSLRAGEERPAMLLRFRLDDDLNVTGLEPEFSKTCIAANLSLEQSEAVIGRNGEGPGSEAGEAQAAKLDDAAAPFASMLKTAFELARRLRQKRIENGAVITERVDPEMQVVERDGEILIEIEPGTSYEHSQLMVGEFMILANSGLAQWAAEREIPLLYRTQVASIPKEFAGVWTEPHEIHRVLKSLPPAKLAVEPRPHAGVGVSVYSSFTAPMRRYADLLNQAQVLTYLQTGQPRLDRAGMEAALPLVSARQDAAGQIQRFRTRYWKLLYYQQQEHRSKALNYWEAMITDDGGNYVTVVLRLTGLVLRGPRHLFGDRVSVGATVGVRVGKVNALRNEIQIMEVIDY